MSKLLPFIFVILAICTTCRKKHNEDVAQKTDWLYPKEPDIKTTLQRYVENTIYFEKQRKITFTVTFGNSLT